MGSITLPSTPSRNAPNLHRSFTLPASLSKASSAHESKHGPGSDAVEVLFAHHTARIVSFSPSLDRILKSPSASPGADCSGQMKEAVGVLPWATRTERTVAAGPLSVYRVPGLVAFLNSGRTLHPILAKSRCWCVDGETKFVLRIRENSYYRIELPNTCDEDKKIAEELKLTFAKLLQYETTPCPFRRGFYVELPDNPETPKRPWKPKHQSTSGSSKASAPSKTKESASNKLGKDEDTASSRVDEPSAEDESTPLSEHTTSNGSPIQRGLTMAKREIHDHVETITNNFEDANLIFGRKDAGLKSKITNDTSGNVESDGCLHGQENRAFQLAMTSSGLPASLGILRSVDSRMSRNHFGLPDKHADCSSDLADSTELSEEVPALIAAHIQSPDENLSQGTASINHRKSEDFGSHGHGATLHRFVRILTAPPKLETNSSSSVVDSDVKIIDEEKEDADAFSISSSLDSFHSLHSPLSPLGSFSPSSSTTSSSPLFEDCSSDLTRTNSHKHSASEMTITPTSTSMALCKDNCIKCGYEFSAAGNANELVSKINIHNSSTRRNSLRRHFQDRRTSSPLPSAANIYIPGVHLSKDDLTTTIIRKTCSILLGPPVQLVALMLNIAQRIADNAVVGENAAYSASEVGLPYSWDSHNEGEEKEEDPSGTVLEDDYGLPLIGLPSRSIARRQSSQLGYTYDYSDID